MTQEQKTLLLQDLSARLLYGVKVQVCNIKEYAPTVKGLLNDELYVQFDYITKPIKNGDSTYNIINDNVKPYLRPMSSMTEEEKEELRMEHEKDERLLTECIIKSRNGDNSMRGKVISHYAADWCNRNHFDYRGLIPMNLALEAPEGMYK